MAGGGHLDWPADPDRRLAYQIRLLAAIVDRRIDVLDFCREFLYSGEVLDENISGFLEQIFRPFARDYRRLIEKLRSRSSQSISGRSRIAHVITILYVPEDSDW